MRKIFYTSVVLTAVSGLIACTQPASNKTVLSTNNSAVVSNSNINSTLKNSLASADKNSVTPSNTSHTASSSDKEFMERASQGGMTEVQFGNAAIIKGRNEEVKVFGQKMITDRSRINRELKDIAKQKGVTLSETMSVEQSQAFGNIPALSGAAFDKEYVKMMIKNRERDVAEFQKQADNGTDLDLKTFAAETLPTLKMHLQMIKDIQGKLK